MHVRWNINTCAVKWIYVFDDVKMRVWWNEYVYLVMQEYGRDESAPTPGGMFVTNFVGERNIINNPLAALSQTTSSIIAIR